MSGSFIFAPKTEDLLTAFKLHYPFFKAKRFASFLAFSAFVGLAVSFLSGDANGFETLEITGAMVVVGIIIFAIIQVVMRLWWMPRYTRRIYFQQADLRQPLVVTWDETKLSFVSPNSHSELLWTDFYQWSRNDQTMLLYRSEALFNFIPIDGADRLAAADAIQSHLDKAGVKQRP